MENEKMELARYLNHMPAEQREAILAAAGENGGMGGLALGAAGLAGGMMLGATKPARALRRGLRSASQWMHGAAPLGAAAGAAGAGATMRDAMNNSAPPPPAADMGAQPINPAPAPAGAPALPPPPGMETQPAPPMREAGGPPGPEPQMEAEQQADPVAELYQSLGGGNMNQRQLQKLHDQGLLMAHQLGNESPEKYAELAEAARTQGEQLVQNNPEAIKEARTAIRKTASSLGVKQKLDPQMMDEMAKLYLGGQDKNMQGAVALHAIESMLAATQTGKRSMRDAQ